MRYPVEVLISNILTAITTCNRTVTRARVLNSNDYATWVSTAIGLHNVDERANLVKILEDKEMFKAPGQLFLARYGHVVAGLMTPSDSLVNDVGGTLAKELADEKWVTQEYVDMPCFGYPREYLKLAVSPNAEWFNAPYNLPSPEALSGAAFAVGGAKQTIKNDINSLVSSKDVPVPLGATTNWAPTWASLFSKLASRYDAVNLSNSIIPTAESIAGRSGTIKENFFGSALIPLEQMDHLTATGLLWAVQHIAFYLELHHQDYLWRAEFARRIYPHEVPLIDTAIKIREMARTMFPLHPLFRSWINMIKDVKLNTMYGEVPCHLIAHSNLGFNPNKPRLEERQISNMSSIAQQFMVNAISEAERFQSIVGQSLVGPLSSNLLGFTHDPIGGTVPAEKHWPLDLLETIGRVLDKSDVRRALAYDVEERPLMTATKLLEWCVEKERFIKKWPELTKKLGWSGSGVAGTSIRMTIAGGDFVLCDGDRYSSDPADVITGLRPCYSLGNRKVIGIGRRDDKDFNTGPALNKRSEIAILVATEWSPMIATGRLSPSIGNEHLEYQYQPSCMTMGEEVGGSHPIEFPILDAVISTPESRIVASVWRDKLPLKILPIKEKYGDPVDTKSSFKGSTSIYVTSWDVITHGTDKVEVATALADKYGPDNLEQRVYTENEKQEDGTTIAVQKKTPLISFRLRTSPRFNFRFPVATIADRRFFWIDEFGRYEQELTDKSGWIIYNNEVECSTSGQRVDEIVTQWPIRTTGVPDAMAQEPKPISTDIKVPE
jgi:hypothetical protein